MIIIEPDLKFIMNIKYNLKRVNNYEPEKKN